MSILNSKLMKTKTMMRFVLLACGLTAMCLNIGSQVLLTPLPPPEVNIKDGIRNPLAAPRRDLRLMLFSHEKIESLRRRGKVCVITVKQVSLNDPEERPATECTSVYAMLKSLGHLERKYETPQIRVVQNDTIVQSDFDGNGDYAKRFLDWPIYPGDVVIVTPRPLLDRDAPP